MSWPRWPRSTACSRRTCLRPTWSGASPGNRRRSTVRPSAPAWPNSARGRGRSTWSPTGSLWRSPPNRRRPRLTRYSKLPVSNKTGRGLPAKEHTVAAPANPRERAQRSVAFVDGARTPFGKAGPKGIYAETRADDLLVPVIRELIRRHPELPPERIDEVAVAATTQIGDQGLTLGRIAGILAGLPQSVPGYSIDRMCAGAMTAVTAM